MLSPLRQPCSLKTGKVSDEKKKKKTTKKQNNQNKEVALQVYLDRVNDIPFGTSAIKMYRGAIDEGATEMKEHRQNLLDI